MTAKTCLILTSSSTYRSGLNVDQPVASDLMQFVWSGRLHLGDSIFPRLRNSITGELGNHSAQRKRRSTTCLHRYWWFFRQAPVTPKIASTGARLTH